MNDLKQPRNPTVQAMSAQERMDLIRQLKGLLQSARAAPPAPALAAAAAPPAPAAAAADVEDLEDDEEEELVEVPDWNLGPVARLRQLVRTFQRNVGRPAALRQANILLRAQDFSQQTYDVYKHLYGADAQEQILLCLS